ncbi:hypothetical protein BDW74DRAFT_173692 [Aspergillus multicolor]|uniref:uncharacterized protein n=1 Tax=Aspergillus multicolor TaxID=41759 RepID=UPI003CCE2603
MSSSFQRDHPDEIHTPVWDIASNRPIVDGKYNDPETGEICLAKGNDTHEASAGSVYRVQRPFPMEKLLCWMFEVIKKRNLKLDSVVATAYAIRIVLEHDLGQEEFYEVAGLMANGIWDGAVDSAKQ